MKLSTNFLLIILLILSTFSCNKDEISHSELEDPFIITPINDKAITDKVINWQKEYYGNSLNLKSSSNGRLEFDYNNLILASMKGGTGRAIVANQVGYDDCNSINYGIGFFEKNSEITGALILKMMKISEYINRIEYLSLNNELLLSVELDSKKQTTNIIYKKSLSSLKSTEDTGDDVIECIADVYVNHGWISVWAWVQTAFIPATAAAITVACIIHNV